MVSGIPSDVTLHVNLLIRFPNVPTLRGASKVARLVKLEIGKFNLGIKLI